MESSNFNSNYNSNSDKAHNVLNLQYFHESNQPGSCGYCKVDGSKKMTSYSVGFSTEEITPEMYEKIMFLGWRRCGDYLYKPNLSKSCCKLYTLRLDIDRFTINKSQRKVMKIFRKFLVGEEFKKNTNIEDIQMNICENEENEGGDKDKFVFVDNYEKSINQYLSSFLSSQILLQNLNLDEIRCDLENNLTSMVYLNKNSKLGDYTSNLFIVIYHKLMKSKEENEAIKEFRTKYTDPKIFFSYIYNIFLQFTSNSNYPSNLNNTTATDFITNWKFDISIKSGHLNFFSLDNIKEEVSKIRKLLEQKTEKEKKNKNKNPVNKNPIEDVDDPYLLTNFEEFVKEPKISHSKLKHRYTIELEPNSLFKQEKYEVYKKYQIAVHKDKESDISPDRYKNAWGSSNLKQEISFNKKLKSDLNNNSLNLFPQKLGTYDLVHKIDGKVIAVGVLDILPTSISSVYLYYDPDYSFLNLGVFSAIREIEYLRHLITNLSPNFKYYCLGFYCHTCQKMRYKGQYYPSQILCPVTLNFVDIKKVEKILDNNKFTQICDDPKNQEVDISKEELENILNSLEIEYNGKKFNALEFITKFIIPKMQSRILKNLEEFILNVGKSNSRNFKIILA